VSSDGEPVETVEVIGARTTGPVETLPLPYTIVAGVPLDLSGSGLGLQEVLLTTPGILVRNRTNAPQGPRISIRGFGARSAFGVRGVTVLLDGIPLTLADGLAQLDGVDPDLLGTLQVLRGPAGALYGNAAGGVLALSSGRADQLPGEQLELRVGQYGLWKGLARVAVPLAAESGGGGLVAAASFTSVEGFREHASFERWIVHLASNTPLSERTTLLFFADALDVPRSEDPGALTAEERDSDPAAAAPDNLLYDAGEEIRQLQVGTRLVGSLSARDSAEASLYYVSRTFLGRIPFRVNELARDAYGATTQLRTARPVLGQSVHLAGSADVARLQDRRSGFDSDGGAPVGEPTTHQQEGVTSVGGFAQGQVTALDRLTGFGVLRYDRQWFTLRDLRLDDGDASDSLNFGALTGMVGASARVVDGAVAWVSWANAYETPTISELSLRPDGEAGFVDDLRPQRAATAELGGRVRRTGWNAELSLFHTELVDELVPFQDDTGRTYYSNAGASHRTGLEAAADADLPWELRAGAAYTLVDARFDDYTVAGVALTGAAVPGIPLHHAGASIERAPERGWLARGDVEWTAATWLDDANETRAPDSVTVDLQLGFRVRTSRITWELRGGVENLTDADALDNVRPNASNGRFFEPAWPRYAHLGFTASRAPAR
jgi:iron complex outermembrane recepter protein